jgi:transposase
MSRRPRRRFSDDQKTKAVLAHVQDGVPVSQVCENLGIHPHRYYEWQEQAFSQFNSRFFQRRYSAGTQSSTRS